jgi:hypothetical protein
LLAELVAVRETVAVAALVGILFPPAKSLKASTSSSNKHRLCRLQFRMSFRMRVFHSSDLELQHQIQGSVMRSRQKRSLMPS